MSAMETTERPLTLVSLTESAAAKIRDLMAEEPAGEAEVLRIAVQGGGCSGFQYALGFDRGAQEGDSELESHGVPVVVDPFSAPYLSGTEIDWVEGLQAGFAINNPNVSVRLRLRPLLPGGRGRRSLGRRRRLRLRLLALAPAAPPV